MNWEQYRQLSQPVRIHRTGGMRLLSPMQTEREILARMPHLNEVLAVAKRMPGCSRLLILAPDVSLALQGAAAWLSLTSTAQEEQADEESRQLFELFTQAFAPDDEAEEPTLETEEANDISWDTDLLIVPASCAETHPGIPKEMLAALPDGGGFFGGRRSGIRQAKGLLIDGFDGTVGDEMIDDLAEIEKKRVLVIGPEGEAGRYSWKRLSFEQGFAVVHIPLPGEEYYTGLLRRCLSMRGLCLDKGLTELALLRRLRRYRGALFTEKDVLRLVDAAAERAGGSLLKSEMFELYGEGESNEGMKKLARLVGLREVKNSVLALYAVRRAELEHGMRGACRHNNLVFSGRPGTGKSVVARIYGEIMAELGLSSGRFVSVGRKDLVGQYLGQTAPLVQAAFQKAEGGVLFIDEAGSFLQDDIYTHELIVELLRHMEEEPQTTVIFASYPDQIRQLLDCDPGFPSRIRRTLHFPDYSGGELQSIFQLMVHDAGFELSPEAKVTACQVFEKMKKVKPESFANAREVRRLTEAAIESLCLRMFAAGEAEQLLQLESDAHTSQTWQLCIEAEDVRNAEKQLLPTQREQKRVIGFATANG